MFLEAAQRLAFGHGDLGGSRRLGIASYLEEAPNRSSFSSVLCHRSLVDWAGD